jgi:hypothetical protein
MVRFVLAFNDNPSASVLASTAVSTANATMPSSSTLSNALDAEPDNEKKRTYDEQGKHHDDDDDDDNDDNGDKNNVNGSGLAAFFHYARAHHKQVRSVLMSSNKANKAESKPVAHVTFGQISEELAKDYKALPATMIAVYQEMAVSSNVDFVKEMKPFSVPTKTIRKKDPDAPKKNISAYFLYMMANRSKISAEDTDMGFGAVTKECSVRFKAMTDEGRKEWEDKAAADKERYKEQMEVYEKEQEAKKKSQKEAGDGSEDDDHEKAEKPNKKAKKKPADEQDKEKTQENAGNKKEETAKEADKPKKTNKRKSIGEQKTQEKEDDKPNKKAKKTHTPEHDKEKAQESAGNEKDEEDKPKKKAKRKTLTGEQKTEEKEDDHAKAEKPKKKEKRPADAPTWYKTGYTLYMEANRETIQTDNPGMAHSEVSKLGSTNFKALPDVDQKKWVVLATADRARFDREMEVYKSKEKGATKKDVVV